MTKKEYTVIDLFAGAGGLSEGFVQAGFVPIAHVEWKKPMVETLRHRLAEEWGKSDDEQKLAQTEKRDYRNSLHWNLDAEYLEPLKGFLENNLL